MEQIEVEIIVSSLTVVTISSTLFILMAGFSLLEAGSVRSKNASSILLKNLVNVAMGLVGYFVLGGGIALGKSWKGFIGTEHFLYLNTNDDSGNIAVSLYTSALFSITASTIMSGAIAERSHIWSYCFWAFLSNLVFYPLLSHWIWNADGWLAKFGFVDVAGAGVVHIYGASSSLIAILMLGPRIGRIDEMTNKFQKNVSHLVGHSTVLVSLGSILLFFGFFGFNGASSLLVTTGNSPVYHYAITSINTSLSGAFGCLTALLLTRIKEKRWSLIEANMGLLNGCVAICSVCGFVPPWASIFFGILASLLYFALKFLLIRLRLDDTIVAIPVHGGSGTAGLFLAAFFYNNPTSDTKGAVYGQGGSLLYIQFVGFLVIVAYSMFTTFIVLYPLKLFNILRIDEELEGEGLDKSYLKEPAYPEIYAKGDFIKFREYLHTMQGYGDFERNARGFNLWNKSNNSSKNGSEHRSKKSRGGGVERSRREVQSKSASGLIPEDNDVGPSVQHSCTDLHEETIIEVDDGGVYDGYNSEDRTSVPPHLKTLDDVCTGL